MDQNLSHLGIGTSYARSHKRSQWRDVVRVRTRSLLTAKTTSKSVNGAQIAGRRNTALGTRSSLRCGVDAIWRGLDRGMRPARNTEQEAAGLIFRARVKLHCGTYPTLLDSTNIINDITSLHWNRCGCAVASRMSTRLLIHHARDLYMYAAHLFAFIPKREPGGRRCEWTAPGHMISFSSVHAC